jgi:hypothetical protein
MEPEKILMGYKGSSYMDSGYFYAPYVPMTQTPVVLDPNSFNPNKGIMSRYGKKLLAEGAKYYDTLSFGPTPPRYRSIDDEWETSQW